MALDALIPLLVVGFERAFVNDHLDLLAQASGHSTDASRRVRVKATIGGHTPDTPWSYRWVAPTSEVLVVRTRWEELRRDKPLLKAARLGSSATEHTDDAPEAGGGMR
jgi:hypothetical protein